LSRVISAKSSLLLLGPWLAALLVCIQALAEPVTIHGTDFGVDQLSEIDSDTLKIKLFGEERIIRKDVLDDYVLHQYFLRVNKGSLKPEIIFRFIQASLKVKDVERAGQGFRALLAHPDLKEQALVKYVEELAVAKHALALFKIMLSGAEDIKANPKVLAAIMFFAGLEDLNWVRSRGIRYVYLYGDQVRGYFDGRFYEAAGAGDFGAVEQIVKLESGLLGNDDSQCERHRLVMNKLRQGLEAIGRGESEGIYPIRDLAGKDRAFAQVVPGLITKVVHREAERSLAQQQNERALRILALVEKDWRTPTTHVLAKEALGGAQAAKRNVIEDKDLHAFLGFLAGKDESLKKSYLQFLERQTLFLCGYGEPSAVGAYMRHLLTMRPDPDSENDNLRLKQALVLARKGLRAEARQKLGEIQTGISLKDRIRVLLAGIYLGPYVAALLVGILLLSLWGVRRMSRHERPSGAGARRISSSESVSGDEETPAMPLFTSGGRGLDPRRQEYAACLRRLGLEGGVSLRAIKAAYRNAVKEAHPDMGISESSRDSDKFIEINAAYERAIELRRELGIMDEISD
jgi:hypothetical protein